MPSLDIDEEARGIYWDEDKLYFSQKGRTEFF